MILLMEEILHQLVGGFSHYLQGFIHPGWCRNSSINSMSQYFSYALWQPQYHNHQGFCTLAEMCPALRSQKRWPNRAPLSLPGNPEARKGVIRISWLIHADMGCLQSLLMFPCHPMSPIPTPRTSKEFMPARRSGKAPINLATEALAVSGIPPWPQNAFRRFTLFTPSISGSW